MAHPQVPQRPTSWARTAGWGVLAGCALGFAQPGWHIPLLGFAAFVPLLFGLSRRGMLERFTTGWVAGSVSAAVAAGEPAARALTSYFGLEGPQLWIAWAGADQMLGGLPVAVFAILAGDPIRGRAWARSVVVASAWTFSEYLREAIFPGAWLGLSSSLIDSPWALQSASVVGHIGTAGSIVLIEVLVFRAFIGPDKRSAGLFALAGASLLVTQAVWTLFIVPTPSEVSIARSGEPAAGRLRFVLVQSELDPRSSAIARSDTDVIDLLHRLSSHSGPADVTVWPEGSLRTPWPFNSEALVDRFEKEIRSRFLIVGVPWIEEPAGTPLLSVAAAVLEHDRERIERHLKTRLLPIAEEQIAWFAASDQAVGSGYHPAASNAPFQFDGKELGISICYEILFASVAREQTSQGAEILLNLSSEGWLGTSSHGPDHMLAAAVLRAIEVGRPVLRSTNLGISGGIDSRGRLVAKLPRNQSGTIEIDVLPVRSKTLFSTLGDTPTLALMTCGLIFAFVERRRSDLRRHEPIS